MLERVQGVDPKPQLVLSPPRTMVGRTRRFTMYTRGEIASMWDQFAREAGELVSRRSSYGISYDIQGPSFQYMCAVDKSDDLPRDWDRLEIPEGHYLVYTYTGHVSGIAGAFDAIWAKLQPEGGIKSAPRPIIELYDERFDGATGRRVLEIRVPIKGEGSN